MNNTISDAKKEVGQFYRWFGTGFSLENDTIERIQQRLFELSERERLRLTIGGKLEAKPLYLEHNSSIFHFHNSEEKLLVELVLTPLSPKKIYADVKFVADRTQDLEDQLSIALDPQMWYRPVLTFLHRGKAFSPWVTVDHIDTTLEYFIPWMARLSGAFISGVPGFNTRMELTHFKGFETGITNPIDIYRELILEPPGNHLKPWSRKVVDFTIEQLSPRRVYLRGFCSDIQEVRDSFDFTIERMLNTWPEAQLGTLSFTKEKKLLPVTTILYIASDPSDLTRLRIAAELREIAEKLQISKLRDKFRLEQRLAVRPVDFTQAMLDLKPQIVHFSAHGSGDGGICFEDNAGKAHIVSLDALTAMFKEFSNHVRCVMLNACYSESQAHAIGKYVDYVIGTERVISDKSAIAFSIGFYQALGAGLSFEEAYRMGCIQMKLSSSSEQEPVLFSRK